jgi:hypothetical protein
VLGFGGVAVTPKAREALDGLRAAAQEAAAAGELPELLAEVERVRVEAVLAGAAPKAPPSTPASVLTIEATAARLRRSVSWVYKHKADLPVVRFPSGGWGIHSGKLDQRIEHWTRLTTWAGKHRLMA